MIVSMWMSKELITIGPDTPIFEAAVLMARRGIRRLPVVSETAEGPKPLGLVTATDVNRAFPANVNPFTVLASEFRTIKTTAAQVMSREIVSTTPDAPIEDVAQTMRDSKIGALLVTRKGVLVGIITESDIFRAFTSFFDVGPGGARITFDMTTDPDIFATIAKLAVKHGVRVGSLITSIESERSIGVIRISGAKVAEFIEDIWDGGQKVLNVIKFPS